MEELSKEAVQKASEYPPPEFKNLSAEEVLRWLEHTNRFIRQFLEPGTIARWKEFKRAYPGNPSRT